jgi:hypothetical protein
MLAQLFNKYKSDRSSKHQYESVYESEFQGMRTLPVNLLEIGIGKGEGIKTWLDFFPKGNIYAVDRFEKRDPKDIAILKNPRVKWCRANPTKEATRALIDSIWQDVKFDIIIDDDLHTPRANAQVFLHFYNFLKDDGMFFMEDVWPLHVMSKDEKQHTWLIKNSDKYNADEMYFFQKHLPPTKVEEFDLRSRTGQPDSYIFKITK